VLTRKPREGAAMAGMAAGLLAVASVALWTRVAWTWYVPIGTIVTFSAGLVGSLFERPVKAESEWNSTSGMN